MTTTACMAVLLVSGTAGDLALARAMRQVGEGADIAWSSVVRPFVRAIRLSALWLGLALHAIAFFAFLALLSWADVSFVVPASALSYAAGAAGARWFLHERVSSRRWAGVLLISSGVLLVLVG